MDHRVGSICRAVLCIWMIVVAPFAQPVWARFVRFSAPVAPYDENAGSRHYRGPRQIQIFEAPPDANGGTIMGEWGDQDAGVGMDNVKALDEALRAAGVEHTFRIHKGLGHGFLKALLDSESAEGHDVACGSWTRTLDFWRKHLP